MFKTIAKSHRYHELKTCFAVPRLWHVGHLYIVPTVWSPYTEELIITLQWRHNGHDGVSNNQPHDCLLNRLFRRRSKNISKLRVTGLCVGCSSVTDEFPAQKFGNMENVLIWWRHHDTDMQYRAREWTVAAGRFWFSHLTYLRPISPLSTRLGNFAQSTTVILLYYVQYETRFINS